ncbi:MAG: GspE/PulE family protein [Patescibacteria group bacterium]|jgi:type IV pilus assembly protein PilB
MVQTIDDLIRQSRSSVTASNAGAANNKPAAKKTAAPSEKLSEEAANVSQAFSEKMVDIDLDTREREAEKIAAENGMPYINLKGFPISPEVISLIDESEAQAKQVLCFFQLENEIRIAATDPNNDAVIEIVARLQKRFPEAHIVLYLTSQHSFSLAFAMYKNVAKVRKIISDIIITEGDIKRVQGELTSFGVFEKRLMEVNLTEMFIVVIAMALKVGSSDIHIEAEEKDVAIRYRIDGLLQVAARIPATIWPRLISRIKTMSGLKINVTEIPQDGRITIQFTNDKMDIRVSTLPTAFGESVVMRLLKSSSVGLSFEQLGLRPSAFKRLEQEIKRPNGMVVTTGPTGSGKTTTLYAILNKLNQPDVKIITLENPIEYRLQGVAQSQIEQGKGYTFAKGLRAILRQDPNVVMVGEIRDLETAETAIQAALTGHLMLSTIHTNDAAGAIPRFLSMGVAPYLLAPALRAVIGQRLVRKVCEHCKAPVNLNLELLERVKKVLASIPENSGEKVPDFSTLKFYKGTGCDKCHKSGYSGRIGIYEVFSMSKEIETITLSGAVSEYQMREVTQKAGMLSMVQDGVLKAVEGMTTPEEVFRVATEL